MNNEISVRHYICAVIFQIIVKILHLEADNARKR